MPRFEATYRDEPIFEVSVPRAGVRYSLQLEKILAAIWANYQPDKFFELDTWVQAKIIAAYRCNSQIEAILNYEASERAKAQARK